MFHSYSARVNHLIENAAFTLGVRVATSLIGTKGPNATKWGADCDRRHPIGRGPKESIVKKNQMSDKLRYVPLLIACFAFLSHNAGSCTAGQAADKVSGSTTGTSKCTSYISAYGVSPVQSERIESNWKKFQSICPAPSPAVDDFVVIFTHDVNFYNYTMPVPVHTDNSGFSNWSAIVLLDNSDPSAKYKREYVWIFRFKRGSFDPARFSSNAKPDYSAVESGARASDRAVDAAFNFITGLKK